MLLPPVEPGQFTSWAFTDRAKRSGLVPSMGSIGDCYDNAMIESFWGRMQTELLNRKRWKTRIELANAIFDYLEIFHNRQRRHFRPRDAHSDRVRTAASIRPTRGLKPSMATPPNPGHIRASGKPRAFQIVPGVPGAIRQILDHRRALVAAMLLGWSNFRFTE